MTLDLNQGGILIELLGAGTIVHAAWKARQQMTGLSGLVDDGTKSIEALLSAVKDQFNKELWGFTLLAVGLAMQFLGGFK